MVKIKLTDKNLKVGKFECKSVTIQEEKDFFKLSLFDVKGYTQKTIEIDKYGNSYPKALRLIKTIKVKRIDYEGIELKKCSHNIETEEYYHSINSKRQYINYYKKIAKEN